MENIDFKLNTEYIHLIQLLKALSLVATGGEAKMVVEEGMVTFNNKIEYRKRLKLRKGDSIQFENYTINIT